MKVRFINEKTLLISLALGIFLWIPMLAADEIKIENITFQSDTSQEVNATITLARIFHESILNFM